MKNSSPKTSKIKIFLIKLGAFILFFIIPILLVAALISYGPTIKCKIKGGKIVRGFGSYCAFPTRDAGKPCTDSDQCEINCIYNSDLKAGECQRWTVITGCHTFVEKESAKSGITSGECVD